MFKKILNNGPLLISVYFLFLVISTIVCKFDALIKLYN
jgi:hypothetical protein